MNQISNQTNFFVRADQFMERVPIASSLSSIVKIFIKCVLSCVSQETIQKSRYFSYVDSQSNCRVITLLFPVIGNLLIWLFDFGKEVEAESPHFAFTGEAADDKKNPVTSTSLANVSSQISDSQAVMPTSQPQIITPNEIYHTANTEAKKKNYTEAFRLYQQAANEGHTRAKFRLAKYYEKGKGIDFLPQNEQDENYRKFKATDLYKEAANEKHEEAALILAERAIRENELEKAEKWLRCSQNHSSLIQHIELLKTRGRESEINSQIIPLIQFSIKIQKSNRKTAIAILGKEKD